MAFTELSEIIGKYEDLGRVLKSREKDLGILLEYAYNCGLIEGIALAQKQLNSDP